MLIFYILTLNCSFETISLIDPKYVILIALFKDSHVSLCFGLIIYVINYIID